MDVGERVAKVEEQIKFVRDDVKDIKKDVRQLLEFRWRLYGATAVITVIVAGVAEWIFKALEAAPK